MGCELLLEQGGGILLESGSYLLIESCVPSTTVATPAVATAGGGIFREYPPDQTQEILLREEEDILALI